MTEHITVGGFGKNIKDGAYPSASGDECPDCGNKMKIDGEKMDIIEGVIKQILRCPQCRRWLFNDS